MVLRQHFIVHIPKNDRLKEKHRRVNILFAPCVLHSGLHFPPLFHENRVLVLSIDIDQSSISQCGPMQI